MEPELSRNVDTPATDVAAVLLKELRLVNTYLRRLCEYEEERRVEERQLARLALSIQPNPAHTPGDIAAALPGWDDIPWGEEQPSKVGLVPSPMTPEHDPESDWWYRDTDRVFRERGTDRRLTQPEIDLVLNPPGRARKGRVPA